MHKICRKPRNYEAREQPRSCTLRGSGGGEGKGGDREGKAPGPYFYKTLSFQGALTIPVFYLLCIAFYCNSQTMMGIYGGYLCWYPDTIRIFYIRGILIQDFYGVSDSPEHGHRFYCKQMLCRSTTFLKGLLTWQNIRSIFF